MVRQEMPPPVRNDLASRLNSGASYEFWKNHFDDKRPLVIPSPDHTW